MNIDKLVLGTATLGANHIGYEQVENPQEFLNEAWKLGIRELDTAFAYGSAQAEIRRNKNEWTVNTKVRYIDETRRIPEFASGVYIHGLPYVNNEMIQSIDKPIGLSAYYESQIEEQIKSGMFSFIQLPYSITSTINANNFRLAKGHGLKTYCRSIFQKGNNLKKISVKQCIEFVFSNENIDKIVIGFDTIEQIKEVVNIIQEMK